MCIGAGRPRTQKRVMQAATIRVLKKRGMDLGSEANRKADRVMRAARRSVRTGGAGLNASNMQ